MSSGRRCWPLSFVLVLLAWHRFSHELGTTFAPPPRESLKGLWDDWWDQTLPAGEDLSNIGTNDILRSFKRTLDEDMFQEIEMDGVPKSSASIGGGDNFFEKQMEVFKENGPAVVSNFGPLKTLSISDPAMVKHALSEKGNFGKGILALVAEDIFGKALITASDPDLWRTRRAATSAGFHSQWLRSLTEDFVNCTAQAMRLLDERAKYKEVVDMESFYLNLALDAVGLTIFGVNFEASNQPPDQPQAPIVQAVYRLLKETDYRQADPTNLLLMGAPDLLAEVAAPRVAEYRRSMKKINEVLNEAIGNALDEQFLMDEEDLRRRSGGTLLQFIVDLRGNQASRAQLQDDMRTVLIAGHETVASTLTWATYELAKNPRIVQKAKQEVQEVLGGRTPTYQDVKDLKYLRRVLTETLRMYPAPPFLARSPLKDLELPSGTNQTVRLSRGSLLMIQLAQLHRHPGIYERPTEFWPERWEKAFNGTGDYPVPGWKGYDPQRVTGLYPTEVATDYAFVGFGGGEFKCIGDQFAMLEATVMLSMLLQRYDFQMVYEDLSSIGLDMAATIHTKNGLLTRVSVAEATKAKM